MIDIVIPSPGESITEVRLGAWKRGDGEWVEKDDVITEIESDKATLDILATASGVLKSSFIASRNVTAYGWVQSTGPAIAGTPFSAV